MTSKMEKVKLFLELAGEDERHLITDIWDKRKLDGAWKQMQLIKLHKTATDEEKQIISEARETVRQLALMEAWQKVRLGIFSNDNSFHRNPQQIKLRK
jgi:hypothetical protein